MCHCFFCFFLVSLIFLLSFKSTLPSSVNCRSEIGFPSKTIPISPVKQKFAKGNSSLNCISKVLGGSVPSQVAAGNGKMIEGKRYLTLSEISKSLQLKTLSDSKKGQVMLAKGKAKIQLSSGQNYITYQQSKIFLNHSILFQSNDLCVSYDDYLNVLVPLLAINLVSKKKPPLKQSPSIRDMAEQIPAQPIAIFIFPKKILRCKSRNF
jgi:hypothetical protein